MRVLESLGVIASEMESSMLFTLGSVYSGTPTAVNASAGATQVLAGTGTPVSLAPLKSANAHVVVASQCVV